MNKKLVAVAVAGMLAAPLAAQAQTANVTLYGRLNLTMEGVKGDRADGGDPTVYRVSSNSSRLGVRGSESLGGGLTAIFQIESNVNADTGGGVLGTRETFVGLQGSWGTFKIGNFLAPYDDIHPIFGNVPTLTTSILSTAALWANGAQGIQNGGFDARLGNSIRYDSPAIGGFAGSVQVSTLDASAGQGGIVFGDAATEKRHAYIISTGGFYRNGPFTMGVAYEAHNKLRGPSLDDEAFSIAGNWNFGVVKIGGVYERKQYDTPSGDIKNDMFGVSLTAPIGPGEIYAYYGQVGDGKGSAADGTRIGTGPIVKGGSTGADQWSVSYTYALSKRTLTYVGWSAVGNDANTNYSYNINAYPLRNGGDVNGLVVGMVHFF